MNPEPKKPDNWTDDYDPDRYDPKVDNRNCLKCETSLKESSEILYCPHCLVIVSINL